MERDKDHLPLILHLAADYKCAHNPSGTTAIPELIQGTADIAQHVVISIRRTSNPLKVRLSRGRDVDWEFTYFGLPFGIFIGLSIFIAGWTLRRRLNADIAAADVIHAHKLSCEALIARRWLKPHQVFVISVRGNSDVKIARFHPGARQLMREALMKATTVLWVSAWAKNRLAAMNVVCSGDARSILFPNAIDPIPTAIDSTRARIPSDRLNLCSIFWLDRYKLKGLPTLLGALRELQDQKIDFHLDLIGGGSERTIQQVKSLVAIHDLGDAVSLLGNLDRKDVHRRIGAYDAMVLPSRNETFGLVYLEALRAGVPVLYCAGTGIDGFLPNDCGCVAVQADSISSVKAGIMAIADHRDEWRQATANYWNTTGKTFFSRESAKSRYETNVTALTSQNKKALQRG